MKLVINDRVLKSLRIPQNLSKYLNEPSFRERSRVNWVDTACTRCNGGKRRRRFTEHLRGRSVFRYPTVDVIPARTHLPGVLTHVNGHDLLGPAKMLAFRELRLRRRY